MEKVNIKITNEQPEATTTYNATANYENNIIIYQEEDNTTANFDYKKQILTRENQNMQMYIDFVEKRIDMTLKDLEKTITFDIKVININKNNKDIEIEYILENNNYIYRIEVIK